MKIILGKGGSGKTVSLIKESHKNGQYIVCLDQLEASRIHTTAIGMGLNIPFPITFAEFLNRQYYSKGVRGFLIDNIDALLVRICPNVSIDIVTLREECNSI